ncbi:RidA family protein [Chloroflexota bacterium]
MTMTEWWKEADKTKKDEPKVYPWGKLYPYYHKKEKMCWAKGFVTTGDISTVYLSGQTGRDPETDRQPRDAEDERKGAGKVVGGIREQTRQAMMVIKQSLEDMGASLENIVGFHYYVVKREDWFDFMDELTKFEKEHCPDLLENPRCGVLLRGVGLDLPDMLCEIEVTAVIPRVSK